MSLTNFGFDTPLTDFHRGQLDVFFEHDKEFGVVLRTIGAVDAHQVGLYVMDKLKAEAYANGQLNGRRAAYQELGLSEADIQSRMAEGSNSNGKHNDANVGKFFPKALSDYEKGRLEGYNSIGLNYKEIAQRTGHSTTIVSQFLSVRKLPKRATRKVTRYCSTLNSVNANGDNQPKSTPKPSRKGKQNKIQPVDSVEEQQQEANKVVPRRSLRAKSIGPSAPAAKALAQTPKPSRKGKQIKVEPVNSGHQQQQEANKVVPRRSLRAKSMGPSAPAAKALAQAPKPSRKGKQIKVEPVDSGHQQQQEANQVVPRRSLRAKSMGPSAPAAKALAQAPLAKPNRKRKLIKIEPVDSEDEHEQEQQETNNKVTDQPSLHGKSMPSPNTTAQMEEEHQQIVCCSPSDLELDLRLSDTDSEYD